MEAEEMLTYAEMKPSQMPINTVIEAGKADNFEVVNLWIRHNNYWTELEAHCVDCTEEVADSQEVRDSVKFGADLIEIDTDEYFGSNFRIIAVPYAG